MSDQPSSGSTEPVLPASSGTPADPSPSTPPVSGPVSTPGRTDHPATSGQPTPTDPTLPGQPAPGFTAPGQPGYPAAPDEQPWGAYPGGPLSQPPGWAWPTAAGPVPGGAYPDPANQPHNWGWPAPVPGGVYPGQPYGWYPGVDPEDPLVPPPYAGFGGWFARCTGALRRGWRQLLPIMLLTQAVPAAVIGILSIGAAPSAEVTSGPDSAPVLPDLGSVFAFYGLVLLAALLFGPLQAAGWAAGTWLVTRQAAGERVTVGSAFRYGWRRAIGLWGWTVLASLLIMVGVCACLLPGIYVIFAIALFGPVYLFERQDPIGRSFGMLHRRLGMVLGRVALVVAVLIVAALVNGVLEAVSQLAFGVDPMDAPGTAVGAVLVAVLSAVVVTPAYLAQLVGLVVTYAEQRAQEGPVNVARLAAELG
ncbi:hypothetical protein ONA70_03925 [Micromonospora yasonensis]|uniref:hypothetical protein n=1 Tax=Micromonospora yasonensis TaxID=1128667 RepID=UPI0022305D7F|nr:hypothetical protein [Micromonospora yasonensis]MCW3839245.1 hypothetical protein [Micromonospora yasonensis]